MALESWNYDHSTQNRKLHQTVVTVCFRKKSPLTVTFHSTILFGLYSIWVVYPILYIRLYSISYTQVRVLKIIKLTILGISALYRYLVAIKIFLFFISNDVTSRRERVFFWIFWLQCKPTSSIQFIFFLSVSSLSSKNYFWFFPLLKKSKLCVKFHIYDRW